MNTQKTPLKKPIPLRIVFLLNALMMFLPFVFYYVFTSNNIQIGDLNPVWMAYTGIAYIVTFILLVISILKRKIWGARIIFILNILVALPAGAYIGIVIALVSLVLFFTNHKIKQYFTA